MFQQTTVLKSEEYDTLHFVIDLINQRQNSISEINLINK